MQYVSLHGPNGQNNFAYTQANARACNTVQAFSRGGTVSFGLTDYDGVVQILWSSPTSIGAKHRVRNAAIPVGTGSWLQWVNT